MWSKFFLRTNGLTNGRTNEGIPWGPRGPKKIFQLLNLWKWEFAILWSLVTQNHINSCLGPGTWPKRTPIPSYFSLLFSFLLSHFMWVLFQLYVHNIWYRFANNVIWHWITSMTILFQIVSCWIVEIVNSQSSSSSEWDSDARKLVCLVGNPCDHPSHQLAKTSSTNNSQDYHQDDNDDHRTFLSKNNAKRDQTRNLNLF